MPRLFLNYRTDDTGFAATLLFRELNERLADDQVFLDHARIEGGELWPQRLRDELARADAMLALIGSRWLKSYEEGSGKRRIELEGDWVRCELEAAAARSLTIVPILVEGASMPKREWLPASIGWLVDRQQRHLRRVDLRAHVDGLVDLLVKQHGFVRRTTPRSDAAVAADLERVYRQHVRSRHSELVRYFGGGHRPTLQEVFVEPSLQASARGRLSLGSSAWPGNSLADAEGAHAEVELERLLTGRLSLRELLLLGDRGAFSRGSLRVVMSAAPRHWILRADPGGGKSTLIRHLCYEIACDADAPLPAYVSLPRWAREPGDAFDLVQATLACDVGEQAADGLAALLRHRATKPGALWLFLDGFDEISGDAAADVRQRIANLARSPACAASIVVTARPYAVPEFGADAGFAHAAIESLSSRQQAMLLDRWLGTDRARDVFQQLQARPALADLCRNPLTLTWLALLLRQPGSPPPRSRRDLYDRVVRVYLDGAPDRIGVEAPTDARAVLASLSLALQGASTDGESWTRKQLVEALWDVNKGDPNGRVVALWRSPDRFLRDAAERSGLLAEFEGEGEGWRFLHRSLREFLVAEALLATETRVQWLARAKALDDTSLPRWAEPFAMLSARATQPIDFVLALGEHNAELALRCLPDIDAPFAEGLALLRKLRGWDGVDLLALAQGAVAGGERSESIERMLWASVTEGSSYEETAYVHFVMKSLGFAVDRRRFFEAFGLSIDKVPQIEFVPVPGGKLAMGSPAHERGRSDVEEPVHDVELGAFALAATAVTRGQYAAYSKSATVPWLTKDNHAHPAVGVSWWEAYLFCAWVDAILPSEAQWEYACRAGSRTRFWSGDSDDDLALVDWHSANSELRTHAVGEKPANPLGLFDLHGNVMEWCADCWHENYNGAPSDDTAWVGGGTRARVLRGGSWFSAADACRSAYRFGRSPAYRIGFVGFRPARPNSG